MDGNLGRRPLGRTGLEVGEIGFGAWPIGGGFRLGGRGLGYGTVDDTESLAALERAFELGVNFVDTADAYGRGHSERLIGRVIEAASRRIYLASKGGIVRRDPEPPTKDFSRAYLRRACGRSLERLGVGCIDLYQLHNPPLEVIEGEEVWNTLRELKDKGRIAHYGISATTLEEARLAVERGDVESVQLPYNLLDRQAEEFFDEAEEKGVAIIIRTALANGLLSGKYKAEHVFPENDLRRDRYPGEKLAEVLRRAAQFAFLSAPGTGRTPVQAALKFCLTHPAVSVVIPGAKTPAQVEENVGASTVPDFTDEELRRLRETA